MRETLLPINAVDFLFGAAICCAVMWSLRYLCHPSWSKMNVEYVQDHFIIPTTATTKFFLVVVPIVIGSGLVIVITERGEGQASSPRTSAL